MPPRLVFTYGAQAGQDFDQAYVTGPSYNYIISVSLDDPKGAVRMSIITRIIGNQARRSRSVHRCDEIDSPCRITMPYTWTGTPLRSISPVNATLTE